LQLPLARPDDEKFDWRAPSLSLDDDGGAR
jgi:hypothetical protein